MQKTQAPQTAATAPFAGQFWNHERIGIAHNSHFHPPGAVNQQPCLPAYGTGKQCEFPRLLLGKNLTPGKAPPEKTLQGRKLAFFQPRKIAFKFRHTYSLANQEATRPS